MSKQSAGLLLYRIEKQDIYVLLVHPGGPFWSRKNKGVWSVPKGEYDEREDPLKAAQREFSEETGFSISGVFTPLGTIQQKGGKRVTAWAVQSKLDPADIQSNTFEMEWPPKSGHIQEFPEVDRADWFSLSDARDKLIPSQHPFLDRLEHTLSHDP